MKINPPVYYLKIIHAMDDIVKPTAERIVFGDAAQYQQLKELAIAYTAKENCLALVGYIRSYLPEKAYFEGKEGYYYNAGIHRVYITCEWMTSEASQFSLHMATSDASGRESLIASEYMPHNEESPLRELWTILQDHIVEEDDFDVLSYAKRYVLESLQKKQMDALCRILVPASEDIVELFGNK